MLTSMLFPNLYSHALAHTLNPRYDDNKTMTNNEQKTTMKPLSINELAQYIHNSLNDNKARDIVDRDVSQQTDITDRIIVCTATSTRHGNAIAEKLVRALREHGIKPLGMEGQKQSEWILVDFQDIIVHIMLSGARDFYDLENLWKVTPSHRHVEPDAG